MRPLGWAIAVPFLALLVYAVISHFFIATAVAIVITLSTMALNAKWRGRLSRLATQRPLESICTFARSFEYWRMDTWVIRAVYEEIQDQLQPLHCGFPLRATDRLSEDLGLDPDDIELDIATRVSQRSGRSFDFAKQNPYYGRVVTAGDMVRFFCHQPRSSQAE